MIFKLEQDAQVVEAMWIPEQEVAARIQAHVVHFLSALIAEETHAFDMVSCTCK